MEELIPAIIVIIASVIGLVSKASKAQQKAQPTTPQQLAAQQAQLHKQAPERARQEAEKRAEADRLRTAPLTPAVHTHVELPCEAHDAVGSLPNENREGIDPCHEVQFSPRVTALTAEENDAPTLTLDWTGENMVKAFVMQEVLTRPAQRRRAR